MISSQWLLTMVVLFAIELHDLKMKASVLGLRMAYLA
jgi:hypothetical protein